MDAPIISSVFDALQLSDRPWFPYLCTEVDGWRWHATIGNHYNLWLVLTGEGCLTCDDAFYQLKPGMCFVFSPGQQVDARHISGERITRFSAHFIPLKAGKVATMPPLPDACGVVFPKVAALRKRVDSVVSLLLRTEPDEQVLCQYVYDLFLFVSGNGEHSPTLAHPGVVKAIRLLQSNLARQVSMAELAANCGMSRSHFDREFCRHVGMPPRRFQMQCRMAEARSLLEGTRLGIAEIAELLGYQDVYFFSRQFKQQSGVSPSAYRKRT